MNYENYPFFSKICRLFGTIKIYYPIGLQFTRIDYREYEPVGECNVSQTVKLLTDIGSVNFINGLVTNEESQLSPDSLDTLLRASGPFGRKIPDRSFPIGILLRCVLTQIPVKPAVERFPKAGDIKFTSKTKESFTDWAVNFVNSLVGPLDK